MCELASVCGHGRPDIFLGQLARQHEQSQGGNERAIKHLQYRTVTRIEYRHYCYVGDQVSIFCWNLQDSTSTSKHTAVSHSSTEAVLVSVDGGLRLEEFPALHCGECVDVLTRDAKGNFGHVHSHAQEPWSRLPAIACNFLVFEDNEVVVEMT